MKLWCVLLAGALLGGAAVPTNSPPIDPPQAIRLADDSASGEAVGLFRMRVAAVGHSRKISYLNSKPDYRAAGNVTFSLSQSAMRTLSDRIGTSDPQSLIGRTVVVAGRIERRPIVNLGASNQVLNFNRWGYGVRVTKSQQLVSITAIDG